MEGGRERKGRSEKESERERGRKREGEKVRERSRVMETERDTHTLKTRLEWINTTEGGGGTSQGLKEQKVKEVMHSAR